jgi:hypothetical protein
LFLSYSGNSLFLPCNTTIHLERCATAAHKTPSVINPAEKLPRCRLVCHCPDVAWEQPVNHFYTPDSSGIVASSGIRKSGMKTAIGTKSELCCFRLFHTINEIALKSMDENHVTTTTQHSLGLTCFSRDRTITYLPVAIAWSIFRRMHRLCGNWKGVGSVAVGQRSR